MSYSREREAFIARIVKEVCAIDHPDGRPHFCAVLDIARGILSDAEGHQRIAVAECNRSLTDGDHKCRAMLRRRITARLAELGPGFAVAEFSGDPRGATVKIRVPSGYGDSFGDSSMLCVPVRG